MTFFRVQGLILYLGFAANYNNSINYYTSHQLLLIENEKVWKFFGFKLIKSCVHSFNLIYRSAPLIKNLQIQNVFLISYIPPCLRNRTRKYFLFWPNTDKLY